MEWNICDSTQKLLLQVYTWLCRNISSYKWESIRSIIIWLKVIFYGEICSRVNKDIKPSMVPMAHFNSHLSDENDQDDITTATSLCIIICFLIYEGLINLFLETMWDNTDGCSK